jgi:ArsR family transcriptional regulator, arsenate/arsenite/antimonite-responsive transcriptional repressor
MKAASAIEALGALAQEHRLAVFRQLVQAGDKGMAAGAIAEALGIPNSSLSFHLAQLIYRANYPAMNALLGYLTENCCAGSSCDAGAACEEPVQERKSA